jgi:hypothetical protein
LSPSKLGIIRHWRDPEARAFAEVWNLFRQQRAGVLAAAGADPGRN